MRNDHNLFPDVIGPAASGWQKDAEDDVSLCMPSDTTVSEWRKGVWNDHNLSPQVIGPAASGWQKGVEDDVSLCVPSDTTVSEWWKGVRNDHNLSPHVIGPATSGWQKGQKTTLVSACHQTRLCLNGEKVCRMTIICLCMSSGPLPLDDKRHRRRR